ncbi:MAG TPA: hypothetical protein VLK25_11480 [Allosphingosinicella sp.]|nr:hypothetical protein [Allosphingosinicella sp.]
MAEEAAVDQNKQQDDDQDRGCVKAVFVAFHDYPLLLEDSADTVFSPARH